MIFKEVILILILDITFTILIKFQIRGTGDAETCGKAIYNSIMKQQFPANQDAIYVGASVPDEVGASNLFSVTTPLRITGVVVNRAVYIARKIGWLPKKSKAVLSVSKTLPQGYPKAI